MEGSADEDRGGVEVLERHDDEREPEVPESVREAEQAPPEDAATEMDATEWLLASDGPAAEEIEPTKLKLNVGTMTQSKFIEWQIVPLPEAEFRKFQRAALGNRQNRRRVQQGDLLGVDQEKYNLMVVAAATVYPDLKAQAEAKGVDVVSMLKHRFAAKPRLIAQIAGFVSDISGGDEADVEVVAGN